MRSQLAALIAFAFLLLLTPAKSDGPGASAFDLPPTDIVPHQHVNGAGRIMQQQRKNAAGEWCCGEGDCFMIPADLVRSTAGGFIVTTMDASGYPQNEFVPERETQPSPDGQHWRCQRPDRSRRCFFAPPPAT